MSSNIQVPYSSSLKRMLGFKLFPDINPEEIKIKTNINKEKEKQKKTVHQILQMKKRVNQSQKKENKFDQQIDIIMKKMVDEGLVGVTNNRVKKYGSKQHLRIVTQQNTEQTVKKRSSSIKLPTLQHHSPQKSTIRSRVRTDFPINSEGELFCQVDAQKYVKHYRAGMSSLKSIDLKSHQLPSRRLFS